MYRKVGKSELSANEFRKVIEMSPKKDDIFFRNKMFNEIEVSEKKTVLESKPIGLGITLTTKCNLRCSICGVWKERWDIPKKTVGEIINLMPYLERVIWQGGEVFLSEYFETLFKKACSYPNLKQGIVTNGLLINDSWARKLSRNNVSLTYSIDSVIKEDYEAILVGAKFEDLIRSINLVNKYRVEYDCHKDFFNKMTTVLNVVTMKSNYRQLESIIDFAADFEFDEMQLVPILGIPGQENIFVNQDQEAGERLPEILNNISKKSQEYGIILHNWLPAIENKSGEHKADAADSGGKQHLSKNSGNDAICYLPWQQMFMTPEHRLRPGCYCLLDLGDINKYSLEEIWNGPEMQAYRKGILNAQYDNLCHNACTSGVMSEMELKVSRYY
jgi:MoaA/NifB/PqqE/SkfB family radical SAM enzyme